MAQHSPSSLIMHSAKARVLITAKGRSQIQATMHKQRLKELGEAKRIAELRSMSRSSASLIKRKQFPPFKSNERFNKTSSRYVE